MNKYINIFFILLSSLSLTAQDASLKKCILEINGGLFRPTDNTMHAIFNHVWPSIQVKGSLTLDYTGKSWFKYLYVWGAINHTEKNGYSTGVCQRTHMSMTPISLGLRGVYPVCSRTVLFTGLGLQGIFINTCNQSDFVDKHLKRTAAAGVFEAGFACEIVDGILFTNTFHYRFGKSDMYCPQTPNAVGLPIKCNGFEYLVGIGFAY